MERCGLVDDNGFFGTILVIGGDHSHALNHPHTRIDASKHFEKVPNKEYTPVSQG